LEESKIVTNKLPETVDLVFPESMVGVIGVVYTLTGKGAVVALPAGFDTLIYKLYTFPTNGIDEFPVSDIVN
jgi:hypothetical protein